MLSVIVLAEREGERLPGVLAALTSAAVEGLVRDVAIVGGGPPALLAALRDDTGAELVGSLAAAITAARSELLLVAPAAWRPRADWIERLAGHLRDGGREALLAGEGGGLFRRTAYGVLIGRARAQALAHPDLPGLRRSLGARGVRIG
jgi:hypothetical protein